MKNGELKIEKGIPMPKVRSRTYGVSAILRQMKVGESILLPGKRSSVASIGSHIFGPGGSTTAVEKDGVRLWRVK